MTIKTLIAGLLCAAGLTNTAAPQTPNPAPSILAVHEAKIKKFEDKLQCMMDGLDKKTSFQCRVVTAVDNHLASCAPGEVLTSGGGQASWSHRLIDTFPKDETTWTTSYALGVLQERSLNGTRTFAVCCQIKKPNFAQICQ